MVTCNVSLAVQFWDCADELVTRLGNAIEVSMNSMTAKLSNFFT